MSAQPIPPPSQILTSIRAVCRMPLSYFDRLLDHENYTELRCFSLVACQTIGASRVWAEIEDDEFVEATTRNKKGQEYVLDAITALVDRYKLIQTRKNARGRTEYSVNDNLFREAKAIKIHGRCPDCQTVGFFKTEFVPVFHLALRKLGACVDSATFRVIMAVIRHTARWDKEKGFFVVPAELDRDDFETMCGLETRSVTHGIAEAKSLGLIDVQHRKGKSSLYWVTPEGFAALERREPKKVTPIRGEHKPNPNPPDPIERPIITPITRANESGWKNYALCEACGHFVDPEVVPESKAPTREAERPARAGPMRETGPRKSKSDEFWDKVKAAF